MPARGARTFLFFNSVYNLLSHREEKKEAHFAVAGSGVFPLPIVRDTHPGSFPSHTPAPPHVPCCTLAHRSAILDPLGSFFFWQTLIGSLPWRSSAMSAAPPPSARAKSLKAKMDARKALRAAAEADGSAA